MRNENNHFRDGSKHEKGGKEQVVKKKNAELYDSICHLSIPSKSLFVVHSAPTQCRIIHEMMC